MSPINPDHTLGPHRMALILRQIDAAIVALPVHSYARAGLTAARDALLIAALGPLILPAMPPEAYSLEARL